MEPTTKTLRSYQVRLVTDVCRATGDVLVEQPTGSGKTVQIVTLVAMQLGRRFTHAVISAPQEQIEQGFVKRDYQIIAFPDHQGVAVPSIQVPPPLIKGARESQLGSVKRVIHYLRQPGPLDHAFACTHAALNRLTPDDLPTDLSGKALFIDEAHHASADGLSQIVALWRERGGQLFFFTATPYRGDGRPVRLDDMKSFRRSLAEHMAEGFAPRHLESEIVALGQPGDTITAAQFTGEEAPPSSYFEGLVTAIGRRWREDGRPKAIVRVPPMQGGRSGELVSRLTQALSSQGARLLDATGTGAADQKRFLAALEAERSRTYATAAFDVMVGIQRVLEGTDWPVCSAVYCVGMPGSLNTVVQFLGRAMRPKGEDYPAEHRDRAKLVFFVPCAGGSALADLSIDHSRHALLTCCFLADHEVGQEWIVLREVRRGIEAALGSRSENAAVADAENKADEPIDAEVRAEVELAMASAREQIVNEGGEPTAGELVRRATAARPDLPQAAVHRVATEILASQAGSTGAAVREAVQREVAMRLRIDPRVKEAMAEAFAAVLHDFRGTTLKDSAALEGFGRQVHGVTGGQMRDFARRLRDAAPRPLTEEQILQWADAFFSEHGEYPKVRSGPIDSIPYESWQGIHSALQKGGRGLPGGSSLARFLAERRGARNHKGLPPLSEQKILLWADSHHRCIGRWPTLNSGAVEGVTDLTWKTIDLALRRGLRGLPGGTSLTTFLHVHRSVRDRTNLPPLTKEQILSWADTHHQRSGHWPTLNSGRIAGAPDETWMGVHLALDRGVRGLPGGSSLARLLAEERAVRHRLDLPRLTEDQILEWADAYHSRNGKWPGHKSGAIDSTHGETWSGIDNALRKGTRGLSGGSSLSKLLAKKRGVPTYFGTPKSATVDKARRKTQIPKRSNQKKQSLTTQQILAWSDDHFQATGKWPNQNSGAVLGTNDETWRDIDSALRRGNRGLPRNGSLARLLSAQRGVANRLDAPLLCVEQILAWADAHRERTGQWPRVASGVIRESDRSETWLAINMALSKGLRGLPDGSSLAKLLGERRGARNKKNLPKLTVDAVLSMLDRYKARTGNWPNRNSGSVEESETSDETWDSINSALRVGLRGLPSGSSLHRLIKEHRNASLQ